VVSDLELGGLQLDLRKVKIPIYNLATQEDHIAPAKSVQHGSKYFGGPAKFVLAGSCHIAGIINPPDLHKYQYWTGLEPTGSDVDRWLERGSRRCLPTSTCQEEQRNRPSLKTPGVSRA
jgi:polyhydroxyalkanoate synthase subunit PhaC